MTAVLYRCVIRLCTKYTFCTLKTFSLPAAGLSRALGCGVRRGSACTRCKWVPPGLRGGCSGRQSHEIWRVTTGLLSDQLEPTRPMETQKTLEGGGHISPLTVAVVEVSQQLSKARQPRYKGCASSLSFVTATNGASACGFVSVRVFACVSL